MSSPSHGIPTDDEFLDTLYTRPSKQREQVSQAFVALATSALREAGGIPDGADPDQFVRDMFDPQKDFRGLKVGLLRKAAQRYLSPDEQWLLSVPIGFLQTEELNGCAVLAPSGGKVILVDIGVLLHMHMLGRSVLALTTWAAPEPFCHDHEPVEWVKTIYSLANHTITQEDRFLAEIKTWHCPSLDEWDLKSAKFATNVELFVLLHEYGHIALGHLDPGKVVSKYGVQMLSTNHKQEFEADLFSFRKQAQVGQADGAALAAATLFRFFDLIEHMLYGTIHASGTHPPGRERWQHIKEAGDLSEDGKGAVAQIESLFDLILDVTRQPH
jgi:hypothetical protein